MDAPQEPEDDQDGWNRSEVERAILGSHRGQRSSHLEGSHEKDFTFYPKGILEAWDHIQKMGIFEVLLGFCLVWD